MPLVSSRLKSIRPSETKAMTAQAAALKAQGHQVITLSQGEPDFDTPSISLKPVSRQSVMVEPDTRRWPEWHR
ncbi:hypothetical protein X737_32850 [Mesorhizobium sp. L48C026A00]|nr:hypothetical protein X737_32850 [Mesorhizobium sp. L48C026A00]